MGKASHKKQIQRDWPRCHRCRSKFKPTVPFAVWCHTCAKMSKRIRYERGEFLDNKWVPKQECWDRVYPS